MTREVAKQIKGQTVYEEMGKLDELKYSLNKLIIKKNALKKRLQNKEKSVAASAATESSENAMHAEAQNRLREYSEILCSSLEPKVIKSFIKKLSSKTDQNQAFMDCEYRQGLGTDQLYEVLLNFMNS